MDVLRAYFVGNLHLSVEKIATSCSTYFSNSQRHWLLLALCLLNQRFTQRATKSFAYTVSTKSNGSMCYSTGLFEVTITAQRKIFMWQVDNVSTQTGSQVQAEVMSGIQTAVTKHHFTLHCII